MKETIKALLPENSLFIYRKIKEKYFPKQIYKNLSYSQNGEDRILHRIFENQKSGFYVDIGAHHPFRFSNTFLFYKMGWKGINVDAMPKSMEIFKRFRPRDINLELAVGTIEKERRNSQVNGGGRSDIENNYFIFEERALNTFDKNLAKKYEEHSKLIQIIKLQTRTLESILDSYLPKNTQIDFLSIDCEGRDIDVLESNNFQKYSPKYIIIEIQDNEKEALKFLNANGYKSCYQAFNSVFFRLENEK